jgi:hypothetical protein
MFKRRHRHEQTDGEPSMAMPSASVRHAGHDMNVPGSYPDIKFSPNTFDNSWSHETRSPISDHVRRPSTPRYSEGGKAPLVFHDPTPMTPPDSSGMPTPNGSSSFRSSPNGSPPAAVPQIDPARYGNGHQRSTMRDSERTPHISTARETETTPERSTARVTKPTYETPQRPTTRETEPTYDTPQRPTTRETQPKFTIPRRSTTQEYATPQRSTARETEPVTQTGEEGKEWDALMESWSLKDGKETRFLDVVDEIRDHDVNRELSLPQLVVCGKQSSGKSSVLEAITRLPFPRADDTCTRFVTE